MTQPPDKKKTAFLLAVVALNLVALAFLGRYAALSVKKARGEMASGLEWGDRVALPEPVRTLEDGILSLRPQAPATTTFLFFFGPAAAASAQAIASELAASEFASGRYQSLGIFSGSSEDWRTDAAQELPGLPIVPDPEGHIRAAFEIPQADGASYTVAIDREARVRLFLKSLVSADLLLDSLGLQAPGSALSAAPESGSEPREITPVPSAEDPPPRRLASSAIAAAELGDPVGSSIEGQLSVNLRRESKRGAGRLRSGADGYLYASSRRRHRVWKVSPDLREWRRLGGFGQGPRTFMMPYDLDVDARGNVFVVERGNQRLQKLGPDGESLYRIPLDPNPSSVAVGPEGSLAVANSTSGARVLRLDESRKRFEPLVEFRSFPWIATRIETLFEDPEDRKIYLENSELALNEVYVRSAPSGRLYALSVWEPTLRAYDPRGQLVLEVPFEFNGLDEKTAEFHRTLDETLSTGALGVLLIFQDLAIGPAEKTAAVAVSGSCPGVVLVSLRGLGTSQLCLIDPEGEPYEPGTITATRDGRWLVANELGVFSFEIPDDEAAGGNQDS